MKKVFILMAIFAITTGATAQLKIRSDGVTTLNAQTQDWWPALRITVPTQYSCAYNLWNTYPSYNKDVFYVRGDGYAWALKGYLIYSSSTSRENVTPIEGALRKVKSLQGVRFQYENGEGGEGGEEFNEDFHLGFIAQEVEKVFPEVVKNMHDSTKAIAYTDLIPVLVEAIKEQQTQIESLQTTIYVLQEQINTCCQGIPPTYSPPRGPEENNGQEETPNENNGSTGSPTMPDVGTAKLFQNVPNPFSSNTEIRFEIPEYSASAKLLIHDMQGAEIKSYPIITKGTGNIIIQGHELQAGMYMYTLLVNNTIIDTKKMILTK
jgi:hypothetical protein